MRSATFFSTLALLPVIISAGPVAVLRRDNSTSAGVKAMAGTVAFVQQFVNLAISKVNSSSVASDPLSGFQQVLAQSDAFTSFTPIINEINCTFSSLTTLLPGSESNFDTQLVAAMIWAAEVLNITASSILSNATELGLTGGDVQMIQQAGATGGVIAKLVIPSAPDPINPQDVNQLLRVTTYEAVEVIRTYNPQCTDDPFEPLAISTVEIVPLGGPFAPAKGFTIDMTNDCPGKNNTNCFCQTISSNLTAPVITPAQQCQMAVDGGINLFLLTTGQNIFSMDPGVRAQQVANGSVPLLAVPPYMFGWNPN